MQIPNLGEVAWKAYAQTKLESISTCDQSFHLLPDRVKIAWELVAEAVIVAQYDIEREMHEDLLKLCDDEVPFHWPV